MSIATPITDCDCMGNFTFVLKQCNGSCRVMVVHWQFDNLFSAQQNSLVIVTQDDLPSFQVQVLLPLLKDYLR